MLKSLNPAIGLLLKQRLGVKGKWQVKKHKWKHNGYFMLEEFVFDGRTIY